MPTVLVTGANRGIGLELARQYLTDGWRVIATCRDPASAGELRALGGKLDVEKLEVADWDGIGALADRLKGTAIDVLFNNAGIAGREAGDFGTIDPDVWAKTMCVNALAPLKVAEAFVGHVEASDQKKMPFVSSLMGSIGFNTMGGRYAYRASKAALNMGCRSLATDLAPRGISVVMLHPGHVRTDMGGASAPVGPVESATGMRAVVEALTREGSGSFINFDGTPLGW